MPNDHDHDDQPDQPGRFHTDTASTAFAEAVDQLADWSASDRAAVAVEANSVKDAYFKLKGQHEAADQAAWCYQPAPEWPAFVDDVTADLLARHFTVAAAHAGHRVQELIRPVVNTPHGQRVSKEDRTAYLLATGDYLGNWRTALLLRALQEHAPADADQVARRMWLDLECGEAPDTSTYQWLVGYRIDPAAIAAVAAARAATPQPEEHRSDSGDGSPAPQPAGEGDQ